MVITSEDNYDIELKRLKSEVRKSYNKIAKQQSTESLIHQAVQRSLKGVKLTTVPPYKKRQKRKQAPEAWLCLSDWQVGKVTDTYNSQIAAKRVFK